MAFKSVQPRELHVAWTGLNFDATVKTDIKRRLLLTSRELWLFFDSLIRKFFFKLQNPMLWVDCNGQSIEPVLQCQPVLRQHAEGKPIVLAVAFHAEEPLILFCFTALVLVSQVLVRFSGTHIRHAKSIAVEKTGEAGCFRVEKMKKKCLKRSPYIVIVCCGCAFAALWDARSGCRWRGVCPVCTGNVHGGSFGDGAPSAAFSLAALGLSRLLRPSEVMHWFDQSINQSIKDLDVSQPWQSTNQSSKDMNVI